MRVARTGPLTWAQHMFWYYNDPFFMEDWGSEPRFSRRLRVPDGTSVAGLEAALAASAERHEALRTFYERPGSGAPRQLVLAAHRPAVTIGPPEAVRPVSIFDQPGFRCQATVGGSTVTSAVLVANQIDLDGASMAMTAREVEDFLAPGGPSDAGGAPGGMQPVDLAEREGGANPGADARGRRAIRYFQALRADAPRNFMPALGWKYASGKTRSVTVHDGTLLQAAEAVAKRCGVSVPSVFHAGICKVVGDWTRTPRFLFSTAVANRWSVDVRDYVGRLASAVDCRFETGPGDTCRSVLERTHRSLLQAYFLGNRDIGACTMEGIRTDEAAGASLARPVFIEYKDYFGGLEHAGPTDGRARAGVEAVRDDHLWFNIAPFRNTTSLNVKSDATVLSEADGVDLLRQLADFIRLAEDDPDRPVVRLRERAAPWGDLPGTRWLDFGASRFSADRIEANIERCHGVAAAAVFASGTGAVAAYVAGAEADLVDVHERLLIETSYDPLVKVPSRYVRTAEPPEFEEREDAWRALAAADRFSPAEDYPRRVAVDERFTVLKEVFIECNGPREVEPVQSYAALGGSHLMISGMIQLLRAEGYTGLHPGDFTGLSSMASLARRMRRCGPDPEAASP